MFTGEELFDECRFNRGGGLGGAGDGTVGGDLRCISFVVFANWNFKYDEYRFFPPSYKFSSETFDSSNSFMLSVKYLRLGDSDVDLREQIRTKIDYTTF